MQERPRAPSGSLLEAYQRFRDAQAAKAAGPMAKAAEISPADIEAAAFAKSRQRVRRRLAKGEDAADALVAGFHRYQRHGGRLTLPAWHRKLTT